MMTLQPSQINSAAHELALEYVRKTSSITPKSEPWQYAEAYLKAYLENLRYLSEN